MILPYIMFCVPVPVVGTSLRCDEFDSRSGWLIEEGDGCITLSRPANPSQNVPAVPAFRVVGVGYCVPDMKPGLEEMFAREVAKVERPAPPAKTGRRR